MVNPFLGASIVARLREHCTYNRSTKVWEVHTPLRAYKVTYSILAAHLATDRVSRKILVELLIPRGAEIHAPSRRDMQDWDCSARVRKMRCSRATVVGQGYMDTWRVPGEDGGLVTESQSRWDPTFIYKTGKRVKPASPFARTNVKCMSGIHFFLNERDARTYTFN